MLGKTKDFSLHKSF